MHSINNTINVIHFYICKQNNIYFIPPLHCTIDLIVLLHNTLYLHVVSLSITANVSTYWITFHMMSIIWCRQPLTTTKSNKNITNHTSHAVTWYTLWLSIYVSVHRLLGTWFDPIQSYAYAARCSSVVEWCFVQKLWQYLHITIFSMTGVWMRLLYHPTITGLIDCYLYRIWLFGLVGVPNGGVKLYTTTDTMEYIWKFNVID